MNVNAKPDTTADDESFAGAWYPRILRSATVVKRYVFLFAVQEINFPAIITLLMLLVLNA